MIKLNLPNEIEEINSLIAGDEVYLSGYIYSARDQAHSRLYNQILSNEKLPMDLTNQTIYYMGPSPAPLNSVIGSCGPTTSSRMDFFTPLLLSHGLKGMIGKGVRSKEVIEAIKKYKAVYFYAFGGCGALYSDKITAVEEVAYPELGPEAIMKLYIKDFPVIVGI